MRFIIKHFTNNKKCLVMDRQPLGLYRCLFCELEPSYRSDYCVVHKCSYVLCGSCRKGKHFCIKHKCSVTNCENSRIGVYTKCITHLTLL